MAPIIFVFLIAIVIIGFILFKPRWIEYKRLIIGAKPFPKAWRNILRKNVAFFYKLPVDLQLQLKKRMQIFLAEKKFYGFHGVEINDEIRVTIAAQACLLILNRKTDYFPKLQSIYVYPAAFVTRHQKQGAGGILNADPKILSGESWELGKVVLSWHDSKYGGLEDGDGHNVVIHEFAHQLDQETGVANGAPILSSHQQQEWARVFMNHFQQHQHAIRHSQPTFFGSYAATNEAEFFAVCTEKYFEKASDFKQLYPKLYQQLKQFYRVDPCLWQ